MEFASLQFSQALTIAFSCVPFIVVCRICQSIRVVFVNRPSVTLHLCNVGPSLAPNQFLTSLDIVKIVLILFIISVGLLELFKCISVVCRT